VLVWIYELDFGREDARSFEQYILDWPATQWKFL
jgi:hypothetical protein